MQFDNTEQDGSSQGQPQPASAAPQTRPLLGTVVRGGRSVTALSYDLSTVTDERVRARLVRNRLYSRIRDQRRMQVRDAFIAEIQDLRWRLKEVRESVEAAQITLPPRAVAALTLPASSVTQQTGPVVAPSAAAGTVSPASQRVRLTMGAPVPRSLRSTGSAAGSAVPRARRSAGSAARSAAPRARRSAGSAAGSAAPRARQSVGNAAASSAAASSGPAIGTVQSLRAASVWPANAAPQPLPVAYAWPAPAAGSAWPVLSHPAPPPSLSYALAMPFVPTAQPAPSVSRSAVVGVQHVLSYSQVAMDRARAVLNAPRAAATSAPPAAAAPVSALSVPNVAQAAPVSALSVPNVAQAAPAAPRFVAPPPVPEDDDECVNLAPAGAIQAQSLPNAALDDAEDDLWINMDVDVDQVKI